jgi:hypothetical protein
MPLSLFVLTLALYALALLHPPPTHDELHHILAARGILATGVPQIAEGVYTRAELFTWWVAGSFALFGESAAVARLPAALSVAAAVAVLYTWLRREAGVAVAATASLLYALSPFAVEIARFGRFYGPHLLLVLLAAIAIYEAFRPAQRTVMRAVLLAAALPLLALALHFQETTGIFLAAVLTWVASLLLAHGIHAGWWHNRWRLAISLLLLLAVTIGIIALFENELAQLWQRFRGGPLFMEATRDQFWFYHLWYMIYYPLPWLLSPLLLPVALLRAPRLAWFAAVLYAVGFVLHSLAGPKGLRYIAWGQPFLFILWALALVELWSGLRLFLAGLRHRLAELLGRELSAPPRLATMVVAASVVLVLALNPAWLRTAALLAGIRLPLEKTDSDWQAAVPSLAATVRHASVVVSTFDLEMLYWFGRYDLLFNRTRQSELPASERRPFGRDPRTGRAVIADLGSLQRVVSCFGNGLFVSDRRHWGLTVQIDDTSKRWVEQSLERLDLPPQSRLLAFSWDHGPAWSPPAHCAELAAQWQPPARQP